MSTNGIPFNLDDVIHRRRIEDDRVEFKATWNDVIRPAVVRTVCAFANDLLNLNGGSILLGIEEEGGRPVLPPRGLDDLDIDRIQKEIFGACQQINPPYQPILFPVDSQGKTILLIWAPAGETKPYRAPEDGNVKGSSPQWYVRQGPMTVIARDEPLRQLMESAARTPFDDRRSLQARLEDLSPTLVRQFLHEVRSDLIDADPAIPDAELHDKLRLAVPVNGHKVPRNVALLFFHHDPDPFFPGARIEVVVFPKGPAGNTLIERVFRGPLPIQIQTALNFIEGYCPEFVRKVDGQIEALRFFAYPIEAIKEALVNAIDHRGYDGPAEPTKVSIYPRRIEITNYPGPVAGVRPEQLRPDQPGPNAPARNRRIGEFLKELKLAEARNTGIPKIQRKLRANGSPTATFNFDDERTDYRTTIFVHPRFPDFHLDPAEWHALNNLSTPPEGSDFYSGVDSSITPTDQDGAAE